MKNLFLFCLLLCAISFSAVAQDCPRIFRRGDTLYTDPAPQYQWFKDNQPIPGATNQWYLPPVKGNYAVQISGTTENFAYSPQAFQRSITGRIIDERYEPIADATITAGQVSVKSDANGWFSLKNLTISGENAVVTITKAGFWKNVQHVHFFNPTEAPLTAMLEPLKVTNRFDATKGATISERGFFLTFPPNAIINETGQTYQGTVHLSLKRSFPSEDGFGLRMPGGDFSAIDANGQEKILVSYGFMSAEMQTPTGEKLRLAPNQEATLEFYIPWEQNKTAPDSMPLWHFDEATALWRPEGIARKVGPRYVGTVKHFSSWNCDVPRNRATVKGKARNCKGIFIPNIIINVGQRMITSNTNGEYTSYVPSDTEFNVTASVDTVSVTPLVQSEEREVQDLVGNAVLDAIGLIDSTGTLTVYGLGVESYSVDSGKTFHPKNTKLTFSENYPTQGIAQDSGGCSKTMFRIFIRPKQNDCQLLDSAGLVNERKYTNSQEALSSNASVYRLSILNQSGVNTVMIANILTCMQELEILYCRVANIPESIGQLQNLQSLVLMGNPLLTMPESIGQLQKLQLLKLRHNQLSNLPESIGQLSNLKTLDLADNQLSRLPESISQLENLQSLDLGNNQLSSIPESISQLRNLQRINLIENQLTSVTENIVQLTNLQGLYLNSNQLTSLPESIGQLTNLQTLFFTDNRVTTLPQSVGQLMNLQTFYLENNQLTTLPESIGQLTNLRTLGLSNNQLTSLPETIGQLQNLTLLYLNNNQLNSLPESIEQLTKLQTLELGNNQLTSLPATIASLKDNLFYLILSGNPISEEEKSKIRSWLPNTNITF